jgi:hypothetical protein
MTRRAVTRTNNLGNRTFAILGDFRDGHTYKGTTYCTKDSVATLAQQNGASISRYNLGAINMSHRFAVLSDRSWFRRDRLDNGHTTILSWPEFCRALEFGIENYRLSPEEIAVIEAANAEALAIANAALAESKRLQALEAERKVRHDREIEAARRLGILYAPDEEPVSNRENTRFYVDEFIFDEEIYSDRFYIVLE